MLIFIIGGVTTPTGIALAPFPLIGMMQPGFIVAFDLLLGGMILRSIPLPALTITLGDRVRWPGSARDESG